MLRLRKVFLAAICLCLALGMVHTNGTVLGGLGGSYIRVSGPYGPALADDVTLEDVRAALPPDVDPDASGADAICCVRYQGLLGADAGDDFEPEALAVWGDVDAALSAMSGGQATGSGKDADARVTRGELAVLLREYAALQGWDVQSGDLEGYWDGDSVPEDVREAMAWSVASGVFRGVVGNWLLPDFPVTRSQLAQALVCLEALSDSAPSAVARAAETCSAHRAAGVSLARREEIQAVVDATAEKYGAVGIEVAVIENGVLCASFSGGWATRPAGADYEDAVQLYVNLESGGEEDVSEVVVSYAGDGDLMTTEHKMRVASLSKVVLGMVAMSLAEDGIVDLDESIGTYWGCTVQNARYPEDAISLDTILSHTSSLVAAGESASYSYDSVRNTISTSTTGTQPGSISSWVYNNFAFGVLGMTLELAADEMMDDILNERFFDILDIDAAFRAGSIAAQDKLVNIYRGGAVGRSIVAQLAAGENSTYPGGYGGLFSGGLTISAEDLAKLVAVLAGDGSYEGVRLLRAESVAHMEEQLGTTGDGFQQCYPLRHRYDMYGREELYYHTGSAWGVYNCLSYDPATGDGVVVLTSGASASQDEYGVYAVCGEINEAIYDLLT